MADENQEQLPPPREPKELTGNELMLDLPVRMSTKRKLMTKHDMESLQQSECVFGTKYYDEQMIQELETKRLLLNPIAFAASNDPDMLYYHQAMKESNQEKFIRAIVTERNGHVEGDHWKLARLNVHGRQQQYNVHYFDTYTPMVTWTSVMMSLILSIINQWETCQIDFVMAYPHTNIECNLYTKLSFGVEAVDETGDGFVLELKKNIYRQKQAGRVWHEHLKVALEDIGFVVSKIDDCVFYKSIFAGLSSEEINDTIEQLRKQDYKVEDKGTMQDYLGINIKFLPDGKMRLTQLQIMNSILEEVPIAKHLKDKNTPSAVSKPLICNKRQKKFNH
eukprot:13461692-Ditylum_brightwellii.AAC.1